MPSLELTRTRWFSKLTRGFLIGAIAVYVVGLFAKQELNILRGLEMPLLFSSVLLLVFAVDRIERKLDNPNVAPIRTYQNHSEFYRELKSKVDCANSRVYTSYLREYPPGELGKVASDYFQCCFDWARRSPDHQFRRVMVAPGAAAPDRLAWTRTLAAQQRSAPQGTYTIRVLDWELRGEAEALSVSLIDDEYLFFAFSGERDKMVGFSIKNRVLVKEYFANYHQKLWDAAHPVEDYLARVEQSAAGADDPTGGSASSLRLDHPILARVYRADRLRSVCYGSGSGDMEMPSTRSTV